MEARQVSVIPTPLSSRTLSALQGVNAAPSNLMGSTSKDRYTPNTVPKCYRCHEVGHKSNVYPWCSSVNFVDAMDEEEEEIHNEEVEDEEHIINTNFGEHLTCVVRRLMYAPRKDEHPQWRKHFKIKYMITSKVCDLIIDGGSCDNIISSKTVQKLGLQTKTHVWPYRIRWITNMAEMKVT